VDENSGIASAPARGNGGAHLPEYGRVQAWLFRRIPAIVLAEPFEIFLVILAVLDVLSLVLHEIQRSDQAFIGYFYGPLGLWIWVVFLMTGNSLIVAGLSYAANHSSLQVRRLEMSGLLVYAVGFGFYGYTNLAVGLGRPGVPAVYPILSEFIVLSIVVTCGIRALTLSNPITALSVTRTQRIKLIKEELKRGGR
jgi:hypothetical protein